MHLKETQNLSFTRNGAVLTSFLFHLLILASCSIFYTWCSVVVRDTGALFTWLGTSCLVSGDFLLQTLRHADLSCTSPCIKWIQLYLLFSYDLFRIKLTNHKTMWVLKDATWWGLWRYTDRLDDSPEIIYLAPWLIIYLITCISSLHSSGALNWRFTVDIFSNFNIRPPFLALSGSFWVLGRKAKVIAYQ